MRLLIDGAIFRMVARYPLRIKHIYRFSIILFLQSGLATGASLSDKNETLSVRDSVYHALYEDQESRAEAVAQARAGAGAKLAQALGQDASAERISAMGQSMASGLLSSAIQQNLSSLGTARVKMNISSAKLDGSEFDFLMPLLESRHHLFFSQTGIRRIDDRTMANLGLGYRFWPSDAEMLGANIFYDDDISRQHKRLGTGLEYARDFFRISANGYYRLSGWKRSRDFSDTHERVANGVDIRTEAWLPQLPQVGGTFSWARYYGDRVGVFGPDDLQNNPQLLTVGVNYTPVPLAGISVQKTMNTRGGSDAFSVALNVSWQPGVPLKSQLDPDNVRFHRTLAGSRYELVDRNNFIVLEYKKDRLFSVAPHQKISGVESSQLTLNLDITSRYAVTGIGWQGEDFFTAGGDVVYTNGAYVLSFPEWQTNGSNHYQLEGRAIDEKGNLSSPFRVEVDVLPMDVKISLAGDLKGEEEQTLAMGLNVRSLGAIGKVDWKAAEFFAAGGKFIQTRAATGDALSLNYSAVLPPYKANGENSYPVDVTVTDSAGNVSNTASARIVVEPRTIVLSMPAVVAGDEGERIALPLTIDSKTTVTHLEWDAPELIAHGGSVSVEEDKLWLTLPAWSDAGANRYTITVTASDDHNHRSAPVTSQISVASASITLALDEKLLGKSGGDVVVTPRVSTQSAVARIEWQGEGFFSAGGRVVQDGASGYRFTLPLWKKEGANRYILQAVAWDKQGRSSAPVNVSVEVEPVSIAVTAPDTLSGREQETVEASINVVAQGTTVSDVQFSADAFFAAGGKVTGTLPAYQLLMPAWQAKGNNHYTVTVSAKDAQGNISEPTTLAISVTQAPFTLTADTAITGFEASVTDITPEVQSLYGVARYEIDATEFKSAGGSIAEKGGTFRLTLPGFVVGGENSYPVTIRAIDKKGTVSAPLALNVVVTTRLLDGSGQCSVVGGGEGYAGQIDKESVNYQEARDYATLKALVDAGTPYIYIPGDVEIELPVSQNALFIKNGTTVFSDRGVNGSEGARLSIPYLSEETNKFPIIVMDSNTRMSGIRYEGPYKGTLTQNTTIGIQTVVGGKNVEVDNMELWGWPWAAVSVKTATDVRVHHSYIHDNIKSELGYGVVVQNGNATAEVACNLFNSNRHAIAGSGKSGEGYAAHHNLVLNGGGRGAYHQFDMHLFPSEGGAGAFMDVTQNWFDFGRYGTSNRSSIVVRGQPSEGPITVTDNWFSQPWKNGTQYAVDGEYGKWVPTVESILATNQFDVKFNYLEKGKNQCVIDWLSSSQSIHCSAMD
ncbi:inverse autotransporter beta domain-containing protein [Pseudocitrobacter corydidari]|uniref:Inverse autotransporter beta-domain domain-containing protein n=1 Tax=Pseudocitrobacter corydidari TaxID=2891570 RepID=A0ABY3S5M9_9ENTR|nr:hypothetical protein G163CM_21200 [Pseudocitrobacter corydidari]